MPAIPPILRAAARSGGARVFVLPVTAFANIWIAHETIRTFGVSAFALIALVSTITQLLPFSDLGLGAGLINAFADQEDREHALRVLGTSVRVAACSGSVLIVLGLSGIFLFSWSEIVPLSHGFEGTSVVIGATLACFGASIPFGLGQRVLTGMGLNWLSVVVAAIAPVFAALLTLVVVLADGSPTLVALGLPLGALLSAVVAASLALQRVHAGLGSILRRRVPLAPLLRDAAAFAVVTLAAAFMLPAARFILAARADVLQVAQLSLALQFYLPAVSFLLALTTAAWPYFAADRAKGRQSFRSLGLVLAAVTLIGIAGAIAFLTVIPLFASAVSGAKVELGWALRLTIGALLVVQSWQFALSSFLSGPSGMRLQAAAAVPSGLLSCGVVYLASASPSAGASGALGPLLGILLVQIPASAAFVVILRVSGGSTRVRPFAARRSVRTR